MKVWVRLLFAAVLVIWTAMSPVRSWAASGPFDLVRGWSGGPWDYQYPWAGCGYPTFGFGTPYTWDQPLGFGPAGPYIWGAPFASPSLYLPKQPAELEEEAESTPPAASGLPPASDREVETPATR